MKPPIDCLIMCNQGNTECHTSVCSARGHPNSLTQRLLTVHRVPHEHGNDHSQEEEERHEHPMVAVADAGGQPGAVVVEPSAAPVAELAVFGVIGKDNLEVKMHEGMMAKTSAMGNVREAATMCFCSQYNEWEHNNCTF